jgi:hypothetical protein
VFPDIHHNYRRYEWLCERAILAPKMIASIYWTYKFKTCGQKTAEHTSLLTSFWILYRLCSNQVEFLNLLEPTGIPAHNLELKIGVPIMLLRNLESPRYATALDSVWRISILT